MPPRNKLPKILTGALYQFLTVGKIIRWNSRTQDDVNKFDWTLPYKILLAWMPVCNDPLPKKKKK